jgi:phosphatidylserine decarboxylase
MLFVADGLPYILTAELLGIAVIILARGTFWTVPGWTLVVIGLFFAWFFRDPPRKINAAPGVILSPADGTVMEVAGAGDGTVIRIFLSVFNVHLQRAPVSGTVRNVEYRPGKFLPAMKPEAHIENEQNIITIQSAKGDFEVRQIAGILARRVVSWVKAGEKIEQGQKIGFIKFGSQVDLTVPAGASVKVKAGDKVRGGLTVIAENKI